MTAGVDALVDAAIAAWRGGSAARAEALAREALAADPDHLRALTFLAQCLRTRPDRFDDYCDLRRRLAELQPDSPLAWEMLGWTMRRASRDVEAAAAMDRVLALAPDNWHARWDRMQHPPSLVYPDAAAEDDYVARWTTELARFEEEAARSPRHAAALAECAALSTNFHLHYLVEQPLPLQRRYAALIERCAAAAVPGLAPPARPPRRRPRIGFVSAHWRDHTVAKLFGELLRHADRDRHEVVLIPLDTEPAAVDPRLRAAADLTVDGLGDAGRALGVVHELACDALVHADIGMHPLSQWLAAFRLAPFQAMLWGHPVSSGFAAIDAFLSSDAMEPADAAAHYAETLHRLPRLGTCYGRPTLSPAPCGLAPDPRKRRYLVAQSIHKQRPGGDAVLAEIAAADPAAEIVLMSHQAPWIAERLLARVRRAFAARELDPARVIQLPRLSAAAFLDAGRLADLVLDTRDWSGGNTTLELAAIGVPTLTLPGRTLRSRHGLAINTLLELPEWIATDADDFRRRALAHAADRDGRAALRHRVRAQAATLFDRRDDAAAFWELLEQQRQSAGR
jgi:predicted O-linked N-acetylglucosamine transferase (SPINDLY family)